MLESIKNFAWVTERMATSGRLSSQDIDAVRAAGFQRVINLGLDGQAYSLAGEREIVEGAGMAYRHIPIPFEAPTADHFATFLAEMDAAPEAKTILHCALNYRASSFAALYASRRLGWERARAEGLLARIWQPNPVWRAFLDAAFTGGGLIA